ncbi:MAG: ATP-dependent zinc metalloprotease FtsH [Prevotella sp.]|nr:ATP-dependent zinc metalloprotease FtsH [Prevotella sp.]
MSNQQPKKKKFNWWLWLAIGLIVILLLVRLTQPSTTLPSISITQLAEDAGVEYNPATGDYIQSADTTKNKIYGAYKVESTYYIIYLDTADGTNQDHLLTAEQCITIAQNPSAIKTYADASVYDTTGTAMRILLANPNIVVDSGAAPTDWTQWLVPMFYIIMILIVVFILWRGMAGRNGIASMGQNRATVVFNGPTRFTDVAGIDEEKEQVAEIVDFLRYPKKYIDMGARIPKGVLLVGQPGTGKTLLAKAIAGEAGVPFFSLSGSDFSEMLVGVGPARMRDLFEQAKAHAPAIIFLDELDSIARMRGVGASGVAEENEQTLNQLLVQMDGFSKSEGVIVLAATNRPDVLDPAILRPGRFDRQIIVQMPDVEGREKILKVHVKNKPLGDVDLKRVAQITSGFTGADLENLLNESAIIAAKDNRHKITMQDITEGINKVLIGPQKKSRIITEEDKRITAYHESGHAIISKVLMPEQTVQEVSIIPRGMAAGYTLTNNQNEEHNHQSLTMLKNRLAMLLGGRTAEQIFIGDICTGASNDIKVATELAENMVTKWGMSSKLGPLYYGKESEVALRIYNQKNLSESVQAAIDAEIKELITDAMTRCQKILHDNASKVKVMAELLLANETIFGDDINLIMAGKSVTEITQAMEKRREKEAQIANDERINDLLKQIEPLLTRALDIANLHLQEKLVTEEHVVKLRQNCELARQYVRQTGKIPPIPTIDFESLEKYPTLVVVETPQPTVATADKSTTPATKKPTAPKQTTTTKKTTKPKETANGNDQKTPSHPQDPTHA